MITLKSPREIGMMAESGAILANVHRHLRDFIKPGVTSWEIDQYAESIIRKNNAIPAQIGFEGYKYATCCSINDEICHGFPRKEALKEGDLIKVDMCVDYKGAISDSCWAYAVGEPSEEIQKLMTVTKKALYIGIEQAVIGNRIGDIGHAIQTYVEGEGFEVVRDFIGHGIGPTIHESPSVPHYGEAGKGLRLKEGMTLTVEPMVNQGTWRMKMDTNGWTARTLDGGLSCQYEHSFAVTKDGPRILTNQENH